MITFSDQEDALSQNLRSVMRFPALEKIVLGQQRECDGIFDGTSVACMFVMSITARRVA